MPLHAELHDIGKLVDRRRLEAALGQAAPPSEAWAHGLPLPDQIGLPEPGTDTWQGIIGHHREEYGDLGRSPAPNRLRSEILLLQIADHIASGAGRAGRPLRERGTRDARLYVLWRPPTGAPEEPPPWCVASNLSELTVLLQWLAADPGPEEYLDKYQSELRHRPDELRAPWNVTSLLSHSTLVGKVYRVLTACVRERNGKLLLGTEQATTLAQVEGASDPAGQPGRWQFCLAECHVGIPHRPVRAADMQIFDDREEAMAKLTREHPDNVLLRTGEDLLLLTPSPEDVSALLGCLVERGLSPAVRVLHADAQLLGLERFELAEQCVVVAEALQRELGQLRRAQKETGEALEADGADRRALGQRMHDLRVRERAKQQRLRSLRRARVTHFAAHPDWQPTIAGPLCEVCQMRPATLRTAARPGGPPRETPTDYVCEACWDARSRAARWHKLGAWDDQEVLTVWIRVALDYGKLEPSLRPLFAQHARKHLRDQGDRREAMDGFRLLPLACDFTLAYREMLAEFCRGLGAGARCADAICQPDELQSVGAQFPEIHVARIPSAAASLKVADLFAELLSQRFPACLRDSPIALSLSIAPSKYPYGEHWRFLERPSGVINIQWARRTRASFAVGAYVNTGRVLRGVTARQKTFLHKLAEIEARAGPSIAEAIMLEKERDEARFLVPLRRRGVGFGQILALAKILWIEE